MITHWTSETVQWCEIAGPPKYPLILSMGPWPNDESIFFSQIHPHLLIPKIGKQLPSLVEIQSLIESTLLGQLPRTSGSQGVTGKDSHSKEWRIFTGFPPSSQQGVPLCG
jgi:hypothetical protein